MLPSSNDDVIRNQSLCRRDQEVEPWCQDPTHTSSHPEISCGKCIWGEHWVFSLIQVRPKIMEEEGLMAPPEDKRCVLASQLVLSHLFHLYVQPVHRCLFSTQTGSHREMCRRCNTGCFACGIGFLGYKFMSNQSWKRKAHFCSIRKWQVGYWILQPCKLTIQDLRLGLRHQDLSLSFPLVQWNAMRLKSYLLIMFLFPDRLKIIIKNKINLNVCELSAGSSGASGYTGLPDLGSLLPPTSLLWTRHMKNYEALERLAKHRQQSRQWAEITHMSSPWQPGLPGLI